MSLEVVCAKKNLVELELSNVALETYFAQSEKNC